MIKYLEKYPILSIIIFSLIVLLPNIDTLVVTIMEARNFITAREMAYDGNWILTTMNGEARYEKPPLPTWLSAISGMIFGLNSLFGLRLPTVLMVAFSGVFMFKLSKYLSNTVESSLFNSFVLVTSFYIIGICIEAPWDIYTHGFMLAGVYNLIKFFDSEKLIWKNSILAGFFVGLSLMSKGPVSLYAFLLPFIISYAIVYKFDNFRLKRLPMTVFILLFTIVGGWWFIYIRITDPQSFIEIAMKETSRWRSYNVRPFYYYWSFFIQSGIWAILALVSLVYPYLIKRVSNKKLYKFSFFWTIIALILLSIIPEKKSRYLVPVLFPLAITTGIYINFLVKNFKNVNSKKEKIPVYFNFWLFGILGIVIPIFLLVFAKDNLDKYWLNYVLFTFASFSASYLIFQNMKIKNIKNSFYALIFFMGSILLFALPISNIAYNNESFNSITELSNSLEKKHNIKSYSYKGMSPELIWHYGYKIPVINSVKDFSQINDDKFGLLISNIDLKILDDISDGFTIEYETQYDMNYDSKAKERLIQKFYILSKKTTFE